jgi:hypothetical protein
LPLGKDLVSSIAPACRTRSQVRVRCRYAA